METYLGVNIKCIWKMFPKEICSPVFCLISECTQMKVLSAFERESTKEKILSIHGSDHEECRLLGYNNQVRTS
jgi:hypothetical protein